MNSKQKKQIREILKSNFDLSDSLIKIIIQLIKNETELNTIIESLKYNNKNIK